MLKLFTHLPEHLRLANPKVLLGGLFFPLQILLPKIFTAAKE